MHFHFLCRVFPPSPSEQRSPSVVPSLSPFVDSGPALFQAQLKPLASSSFLFYSIIFTKEAIRSKAEIYMMDYLLLDNIRNGQMRTNHLYGHIFATNNQMSSDQSVEWSPLCILNLWTLIHHYWYAWKTKLFRLFLLIVTWRWLPSTTPNLSSTKCHNSKAIWSSISWQSLNYYQGLMPQYFYFILNTLFFFLIFYIYPIWGVCKTNIQVAPEMESISGLILIITSVYFVLSGIMTSR